MKNVFFSAATLLVFAACQGPAKPRAQVLNAYIRYLATERQTRAEATYKQGDTPASAYADTFPSGLRYQGEPMRLLTAPALAYLAQPDNVAPSREHVFSWNDANKKPQQATLLMEPLTDFSFGSDTVSRKRAATLRWQGPALQPNESLILFWENLGNGQTHPMEITSVGSARIDFPAAKFAELEPGQWALYVVRKQVTKLEVAGMQVTGLTEFYSAADTLRVE